AGPARAVEAQDAELALGRAAGLGLGQLLLRPLPKRRDLLRRRQREEGKLDLLLDGRERGVRALDPLPAEQVERRGPAQASLGEPYGPARSVGDCMERLEGEPAPGLHGRAQVVVEADERHHVPGRALEVDALAAGRGADRLAEPARVVGRVAGVLDA